MAFVTRGQWMTERGDVVYSKYNGTAAVVQRDFLCDDRIDSLCTGKNPLVKTGNPR